MFEDDYEKEDIFESEPLAPEITPGADVERIGPTQVRQVSIGCLLAGTEVFFCS